jgi:hypothetical protein
VTARALPLLVALLAAPLVGCAVDRPGDAPDTGEVVMQLVQPGPHGNLYHLANATVDIRDGSGATTTITDSGFEAQLDVKLPPGIATITLREGWTLEKSTDGGATFQPVGALLGSANPNLVRVLANSLVFVSFDFAIRDANGTLALKLGIEDNPRELVGGVVIETATDGLADYATLNRLFDFGIFFNLVSTERVKLDDGTKQLIYTAFGQQGSFGPVPLPVQVVAAEFYNDRIGVFANDLKIDLEGAFLTYTVAAKPDGTFELSGQLLGRTSDFEFGPNPIDVPPSLDADGFANDEFWYDSMLPFSLFAAQGTATGQLRMRHILPAQ